MKALNFKNNRTAEYLKLSIVLVLFAVLGFGSFALLNAVFGNPLKENDRSVASGSPASINSPGNNAPQLSPDKCVPDLKNETVSGNSLSGLIPAGANIVSDWNYYACHEPQRGDIALLNYAGKSNPLIKIVKGVPGDQLALAQSGGGWNILINGAVLKISKGEAYAIPSPDMLNLYIRDYKGVLPKDAYLLLGNLAGGSEDSTVFGLVDKSDLVGKVLR